MSCDDPVHAREIIEDCIAIGLHMEVGEGDELFLSGRGDPIAVQVVQQHLNAVLALLRSDPVLAKRALGLRHVIDEERLRGQLRDFLRNGVINAGTSLFYARGPRSGEAATPKHPETPPLTQDQRRRVYQAIAQPLPEDLR